MTYMDHVEVIVEKEMYARDGVHKGMQGWITEPENINGYRVCFSLCWWLLFGPPAVLRSTNA